MTGDKTERAVQAIVRRQNGSLKTTADLYDLILAVNDDGEDRHTETLGRMESLETAFGDHCDEGERRDREIGELRDALGACPAHIADAVQDADQRHLDFHNAHLATDHAARRASDPAGSDWAEERSGGPRMESATEEETSRQRFTKEQIVTAIIIFLATISTNAVVVWLIVRTLEEAAK